MLFIFWLLNFVVSVIGHLGLLAVVIMYFDGVDQWLWIVSGMLALFGLILGILDWGLLLPPHFLWISSKLNLLGYTISSAISYALFFFSIVPFIWLLNNLFNIFYYI